MRPPTEKERVELTDYLHLEAINELEWGEVAGYVSQATIGVFDNYMSEGPGYTGKLMVVIWAYPEMYELYLWDKKHGIDRVKQDQLLRDLP